MASGPSIRRLSAAAVAVVALVAGCGWNEEENSTGTSPAPSFVKEGVLTVCTSYPYEPFEFKRNGKLVGFDIDLVKAVAKRLELKPEIVNANFDAIASGRVLNNGKCDVAVAAISITGERARVLDFSSPYFNAGQTMVVREDSDISSLEDLSGLQIGVQEGTTGELYVTDNAPRDAEIVPYKDLAQVDGALDTGEVDAAIYDSTVVDDVVTRYPEFTVAAEFDTVEQYGMAVKKNSNVDLLRIINDVLADLRSGKKYDAIYNRWFGGSPGDQ